MKKLVIGLFSLALLLSACAPSATEQPQLPDGSSYPNPSYPNPDLPDSMTAAEKAAFTHLSMTLNLPADQIALVSTEAVIWSDGCLGVSRPGVVCTQALVEGFKIILEANGTEYELHTDKTGSAVVVASEMDVNVPIEDVLIKRLSENLGLEVENVSVVTNESAEFEDTCLGVVMPDVMCAEALTPGRIVVLEADEIHYEYHVSEDGSRIQPATIALTWSRDGGIAGFCDRLTVFLSGEVYGSRCKSQDGRTGTFATLLTFEERGQFNKWMSQYGETRLDASDPKGTADGMFLVIELFGNGKGKPGKPMRQEIFTWAQGLFQELYK